MITSRFLARDWFLVSARLFVGELVVNKCYLTFERRYLGYSRISRVAVALAVDASDRVSQLFCALHAS